MLTVMQWLQSLVDEVIAKYPDGQIVVSSGVTPSGKYHVGTLREIMTAEAIAREVRSRGRSAQHLHFCDDFDVFRKVPADIPADYEQYLGQPVSDIPAPDGSNRSYADYYLEDLFTISRSLHLDMEVLRANELYRTGRFVTPIERALTRIDDIRRILEQVSGRALDDTFSPVQILEEGRLKNRHFDKIDTTAKTVIYRGHDGAQKDVSYVQGQVKLNWRIDWPARWWLYGVQVEPFGRDHATRGGSYDTGKELVKDIFGGNPPIPVPYHFINRSGETKKMSKSAGNVITAVELLDIVPAEILWYFMLRFNPEKQLFFDEKQGLMKLFDDFAALLAKTDKTDSERHLLDLCLEGINAPTASNIPFTHLVVSYQASLKDANKTIEVIARTEHAQTALSDQETILRELTFIDTWLQRFAPDEVRFELRQNIDQLEFNEQETAFLAAVADKIADAPSNASGDWFHMMIYERKDAFTLETTEMFSTLYRALIGKSSGPRAGWFLSILPRDWLVQRLRLLT